MIRIEVPEVVAYWWQRGIDLRAQRRAKCLASIARRLLPDLADLKRQAHLKRQQATVAHDFGREELAQLYATESRSLARSMVELRGVVRDWAPDALEEE